MIKKVPVPSVLVKENVGICPLDEIVQVDVKDGVLWMYLADDNATEEELLAANEAG